MQQDDSEIRSTMMPDSHRTELNSSDSNGYYFKVLFGPMYGSELFLTCDDYFFIIQRSSEFSSTTALTEDNAIAYAHNMVYLPCECETASPNMTLRLKDEGGSPLLSHYQIETISTGQNERLEVAFNTVFQNGNICFAVRSEHEEWSQAVKDFIRPAATIAPPLPKGSTVPLAVHITRDKRWWFALSAVFFIAILAGYVLYPFGLTDHSNREKISLTSLLTTSPFPGTVVKGRDDVFYIITTSYDGLVWIRHALDRHPELTSVMPVWLSEQQKKTVDTLRNNGFPVIQLDVTDLHTPTILVSGGLNPAQQTQLRDLTFRQLPFISGARIASHTADEIAGIARSGLSRLQIDYRTIKTPQGYTYVVRDALSDSTLMSLRNFINAFYAKWGNTVVTISINLNENWLDNKSYVNSAKGYLFMDPYHWYFPNETEMERN